MIVYTFFVEGDPVAQPRLRPRMTRRGRLGVVMPTTAAGWRQRVVLAAYRIARPVPLVDAIEVDLGFIFARPGSHYRKSGQLKGSAPRHHTVKPDRDNIEKSTQDALNGILWKDDAQIVDGRVSKRYVAADQPLPGCLVTVRLAP